MSNSFCNAMLDKASLTEVFDCLGTPGQGRKLIVNARAKAPVRSVMSRGGNVITSLSSRKMGRPLLSESRHLEFPAMVGHEFDQTVLEYYPQPCELRLELVDDATGEIKRIQHTPDLLVIRADGFTLEEWKSEEKLQRLAERYPYRFTKGPDGRWYAPQIERQIAELGIAYRICTQADVPGRRMENIQFLADYFHPGAEPCDPVELERLQAALREKGELFISELTAEPYGFSSDFLFKAIADQLVVADLERESLSSPRKARLFRDETLREFSAASTHRVAFPGAASFVLDIAPGVRFEYQSQALVIALVSEKEVVCTHDDGRTVPLQRDWFMRALEAGEVRALDPTVSLSLDLARFTETQMQEAIKRHLALQGDGAQMSERTQRRWAALQAVAVANGANEVVALVPQTEAKGNRTPRLTEQQEELVAEVIEKEWCTNKAINYRTCYRQLLVLCDEAGCKAPSYPTLILRIKSQELEADARIRHGKRIAYQTGSFVAELKVDTPIHGSRPFQYVHIDHTQLDIELICSRTGKPLGRPWLTLAVDAWSRRIVGFYLTFDPPAYASVMMVLRDMVRRFGRLPELIVVDNGKDLASAAFTTFLFVTGVHLRFRPAGRPRHGAVLERLFGRLNTEYIHNLAGNTKATKNVRMVTGSHLPERLAEWTLAHLFAGIQHWATEFYDQEPHPALSNLSPRDTFVRGLKEAGARPQRQIAWNRDFLIATCPPVDRSGVRQVNRQRGVKVGGYFYWSAEFNDARVAGQSLTVRCDPWDATSVYVRLKDRWIQAVCRELASLGQLTEPEHRLMTEEYQRRSGKPHGDERSKQRLREFMGTHTPEGVLALELCRMNENKALCSALQMGAITPFVHPRRLGFSEVAAKSTLSSVDLRSITTDPSAKPAESCAADGLFDFDTF